MREIKFRAWDKKEKKMIYFDLSSIYGYEGIAGLERQGVVLPDQHTFLNFNSGYGNRGFNDNLEIMQYTGLGDKSGKEIYEGDIVADDHGNLEEIITSTVSGYSWRGLTVIGNIYENPELLEE